MVVTRKTDTLPSGTAPSVTQDGSGVRSLPAIALLASTCVLAWAETGSISASDWLLYAIFAGLLLALVLAFGTPTAPHPVATAGLAALVLFAAWQAASAAWSPLPSLARDDALLTLFYVAAFSIALLTVRGRLDGALVTGAVAATGGGLAVATALALRYGAHPGVYFVDDGRLDWPITYPNADAAMFLVGLWPGLVLAAERRLPAVARGLALGAATAALAGWLLTQSKGGGIALAVSAVIVFAVSPSRLRLLVPTVLAAALVGPQFGPLTDPFNAGPSLGEAARHGGFTLLWLTAAAAVVGVVYALVDRRVAVPTRIRRVAGAFVLVIVVAAAIGAPVAFFTAVEHPDGYLQDKWHAFKHAPRSESGSTHFISLGSNRYDTWRVAFNQFRRHPLAGVGGRGFGPAYLVERRTGETPVRSHSVEMDALGELGIVGLLLLVAGLVPPIVLCIRGTRRRELAATAGFATAAYWLVHASGDWNWNVPSVGLPFFIMLGAGAAWAGEGRPLRSRVALPLAGLATAVAVFAFAPPWLSGRLSQHVLEGSSSPASDLRWARRLDPLSVQPYLVQADVAPTAAAAIPPLQKAARKQPHSVEVRFELALGYVRAKRTRAALRELHAALRLEPGAPAIEQALRRVQHR